MAAKQLLGIGQARNRLRHSVERTVPCQFYVYVRVTIWYALRGHHPEDLAGRRQSQHWNAHKTEPAFEDILAKLRGTLVVERITGALALRPAPHEYRDYELACAAAAEYSHCETHRE
ncbi:hypothetical protein ACOJVU_09210 [Mycobacterium sp. THU-M104]|uniref:hypothetical protein n=1 Tax=Mycobacterium sp. THU-M104 TaxID=3410515 RepID=UPI003B9B9681